MASSRPPLNPYGATPLLDIDVECVATGVEHNARAVAQIALVDQFEPCLLNVFVKPPGSDGALVPAARVGLRSSSRRTACAPLRDRPFSACWPCSADESPFCEADCPEDVQWLNLVEGTDFAGMLDLAGLWRVWNAQYNSWSVFGQDHLVKTLLGAEVAAQHDAASDALKSVRMFNYYNWLQSPQGGGAPALENAKARLLQTPPEPSFAKKNPSFEGCCMGNRKTCTCGAPFLG